MDPKSRRLVWLLVGALGIGLIVEGVASAMAFARYSPVTHVLAREDARVPIFAMTTPPPPDQAARQPGGSFYFGFTEGYRLPDGTTVQCRYIGPIARCSDGWAAVFPDTPVQ
ncbi:MAG: hypothetical protein AAFY77_12965 [Pseudomonadota bacterium]